MDGHQNKRKQNITSDLYDDESIAPLPKLFMSQDNDEHDDIDNQRKNVAYGNDVMKRVIKGHEGFIHEKKTHTSRFPFTL